MNTTRVLETIVRFFFQNLFTKSIYKMIYKNNFYSRRLYFLYIINAIFLIVIKKDTIIQIL